MGGNAMGEFVTRAELAGRLEPLAEIRVMLREDMARLHTGQLNLYARVEEMDERITSRQDVQNGRMGKAENAVTSATEQVRAAQATVTHIDQHGCQNLGAHRTVLGALEAAGMSPAAASWRPTPKQAAAGGGLVALGALLPTLLEWVKWLVSLVRS